MRLAYFPNQIAFNGQLTMKNFISSAKIAGFEIIENSLEADAAVIWSVLWSGRLEPNKIVYDLYRSQNKPVFILEVGSLRRGYTWKLALNDITSKGIYGNEVDLDSTRPGKISKKLFPTTKNRKEGILIACQHEKSQQWAGNPSMNQWIDQTINHISKYSQRPIFVRPHPRSPIFKNFKKATVLTPKKLSNTHEEYDIDYEYHCTINYNSGPSISSVIHGTPIICDSSSLAWPMAGTFENIEKIELPDRESWFLKICHTEWTNEEILSGIPLRRLMSYI